MNYYLLKKMKLYLLPSMAFLYLATTATAAGHKEIIDRSNRLATSGKQFDVPVTGTVTDETGQLLIGVTVKLKGTTLGEQPTQMASLHLAYLI